MVQVKFVICTFSQLIFIGTNIIFVTFIWNLFGLQYIVRFAFICFKKSIGALPCFSCIVFYVIEFIIQFRFSLSKFELNMVSIPFINIFTLLSLVL